jgi:hypothetical protein
MRRDLKLRSCKTVPCGLEHLFAIAFCSVCNLGGSDNVSQVGKTAGNSRKADGENTQSIVICISEVRGCSAVSGQERHLHVNPY